MSQSNNGQATTREAIFPPGIHPELTLGKVIDVVAKEYPSREAIVANGIRKTWKEYNEDINKLAIGLMDLGIGKKQIISIWAKNNYEWMVAWYAIAKIGAILVPLDHWFRGKEAHYILHHSQAVAVICTSNYISVLEEMDDLPDLQHLILMNESDDVKDKPWKISTYEKILGQELDPRDMKKLEDRMSSNKSEDVTFILYTSGTTGRPKGAMLTNYNIVRNNMEIARALQTCSEDAFLIPVPFSHCFGCELGMTTATLTGAKMVPLLDQVPKVALESIAQERCSIIHGTPTHFIRYLSEAEKRPDLDLTCLRSGIVAGAPCPLPVMKDIMEKLNLYDITNGYGMTETSPIITITNPNDPLEKRMTTVGRPIEDIEVRIVNEDNEELLPGNEGELVCKGWNVMKGYYKNLNATQDAIDEGGWMHTGDLATKDTEGYYKITGRIKDIIIYGGANVYPKIVEDFLLKYDDIYEAAVVGVPDPEYGEVVACVAHVKEGITEQEIVDRCYGNLNDFSVPRFVKLDISIPLNGRGKVQKYILRNKLARMKKENTIGNKVVPTKILEKRKKK